MKQQSKISQKQTIALKTTNNKTKQEMDYFITGPGKGTDKATSGETKVKMHYEFVDIFIGIRCFKGTLSLKVKDAGSICTPGTI